MAGYFKVSMDAARAIVGDSDGPELLAGYVTVCGYAFGNDRGVTAAGAKSIRQTTGCTDFRSKRIMNELRSLRYGERGENGLLVTTNGRVKNAAIYRLAAWDGVYSYLPSLLLERHPQHGSPLSRLLAHDEDRAVIRDALLLLLHIYASTDYAEWFGCPPDTMTYQEWRHEGYGGDDFELGMQGTVAGLTLWLVAENEDDTWRTPLTVMTSLFGADEEVAKARFWPAWWCLRKSGLTVPVIAVHAGGRAYPLWVYSAAYRESLREHGIVPDLAKEAQLAACDSGLDPDNLVIRYAVDELERAGSGLFYCFGVKPTVRTVIAPRLHAPTPVNLDGLTEAATVTKDIWRRIRAARRAERAA